MRGSGRTSNFRVRRFFGEELYCRQAENFRQTINRARPHILGAPLNPLIPLHVSPEKGGELLLSQFVPRSQFAQSRCDEFSQRHSFSFENGAGIDRVLSDTFLLDT